MSVLAIVVIVVVALAVVFFVGGLVVLQRRRRRQDATFEHEVAEANDALAAARAEDRGWDPERLEAAARAAFEQRGTATLRALHLVQVIDRPGTEEDEARFRGVDDHGRSHEVVLRRTGDSWVTDG